MKKGYAPPLGSEVFDEHNELIGYIGQGGLLYARVSGREGVLKVMYDVNKTKECKLHYTVNNKMSTLSALKNTKCI